MVSACPMRIKSIVMSIIIIHKLQCIILILRRKPKWIVLAEVVRRHGRTAGCSRHRAEGGILVVRGDSVRLLEEYEFRDVLVAVVGVEEVVLPVLLEDERACRHRLRRIPAEHEVDGVVGRPVQALDAEVAVVYEAVVGVGDAVRCLDVFDAPPHAVELHYNVRRSASPGYWPVLAVVGNLPDAGRGLDESLVAIQVKCGDKFLAQRRRVAEVGYLGVLVEGVGCIGSVRAEVEGREAVPDVVVLVCVFVQRRVLDRVRKLAPVVVAVAVRPRLAHHRA